MAVVVVVAVWLWLCGLFAACVLLLLTPRLQPMEDDGEDYSRVSFAESYSAEDDDFMGHSATAGRGQNNDAKATVRYHPTTCLPARVVSLTLRPVCVCGCGMRGCEQFAAGFGGSDSDDDLFAELSGQKKKGKDRRGGRGRPSNPFLLGSTVR